jgi:hypothetical protein
VALNRIITLLETTGMYFMFGGNLDRILLKEI